MARKPNLDKRKPNGLTNCLRKVRLAQNMTASELSKRSGVHPNLICGYENGVGSPNIETALKLCRVLGVTLDEVFGDQANAVNTADEADLAKRKAEISETAEH